MFYCAENGIKNDLPHKSARQHLDFKDSSASKKAEKSKNKINKKKLKLKKVTVNQSIAKRVLRPQVDPSQISGSRQRAPLEAAKTKIAKKYSTTSSENRPSKVAKNGHLHKCESCKKQFHSRSSVLKHKHYCPKLKYDRDDSEIIDSAVASSSSWHPDASSSRDIAAAEDVTRNSSEKKKCANQGKPEATSSKRRSKSTKSTDLSSFHEAVLPTPAETRPKKTGRLPVKSSKDVPISNLRNQRNSKKLPNILNPAKVQEFKPKQNGLNAPVVESRLETARFPVRSSRKATTRIMDDQVEASFLVL